MTTRFHDWQTFHRANPRVFELFRQYANEALNSNNRHHFGARSIGERIRWYTTVETSDPDFKVNDHQWPYYARLLMVLDKRFADFFNTRDARFDASDTMILAAHQGRARQQELF